MKIGDKVRFLSEVGGGVVTGFQGKDMVLVEDADGFDIPMPIKECVVIDTDDYNMKRKPGCSGLLNRRLPVQRQKERQSRCVRMKRRMNVLSLIARLSEREGIF